MVAIYIGFGLWVGRKMISSIINLIQTKDISSFKGLSIEIWDLLIFITIFWLGIGMYYFKLYIVDENKS